MNKKLAESENQSMIEKPKMEMVEKEQSEFGKGFTYCISLFLMHTGNETFRQVYALNNAAKMSDEERKKAFQDIQDNPYNYATDSRFAASMFDGLLGIYRDKDRVVTQHIEMWASGASDHLYEMEVPEIFKGTEIERKALELQEIGLRMGHGFDRTMWTIQDLGQLIELAKDILLMVDKEWGIKVEKGRWE